MKALVLVVAIAAVAYYAWDRYFSRSGRIERAYQGCVAEMAAGADKATANMQSQMPKGNDPASTAAKGMADAMTSMWKGMGGAMCSVLKDTCTKDFDGTMCQAALGRYR